MDMEFWVIIRITNMIEIINSLIQFYTNIFLFYFMQGNVWIEDIFQEILLTIPKRYSEKQEPSSRRDRQHFSSKLHPIKKITEVSPGSCLQSTKSWRTNRSINSQLPLRTTSALDLLQRSTATLSSSLDLSTWCNPTSSVGRHTKMIVLISNTS